MGKLTRKQAAAFIQTFEKSGSGFSKEEVEAGKADVVDTTKKSLIATPEFKGIDAEGIDAMLSFNQGISDKKSGTDESVKTLGKKQYAPLDNIVSGVDFESFDRMNLQNNVTLRLAALNAAANNLMTKDDGIVDLFTVAEVSADETGKKIIASNPLVTYGTTNINGVAVGGTKVSLISNLDNKDIFSTGRLPLLPILRSSGDYPTNTVLQGLVTRPVVVGGESVQTAPILVGKEINLRTLCSNSAQLNEFGALVNPNITMSEEGHLKSVYLKVEDSTNVVNLLKFDVKGENGTRFTTSNQGNGKDVQIDYRAGIKIKTSDLIANKQLAYTSTANTLVTELQEAGLEINLKFTVNVNANTDSMAFSTSATGITVVSVLKDGVALLDTNATVVAIKALFAAATVDSIDAETWLSNTNNTDNGIVVDVDEEMYEIPAVIKAPVTFKKSVLGKVDADQLAGYLVAANIASASMLSAELITLIEECVSINAPKADADGYIKGVNLDGIGQNYIKPMIKKVSIDATDRITRRSGETKDDISKAIFDRITAVATKVFTDSGFDKAVDSLATGEQVTLQLVSDRETLSYIKIAIGLTPADSLSFDVATSISTKVKNKVYATFKLKDVYEFTPFILVKAPTFIYRGIELAGNSGNQDTCKYVPRRNAIINVPLLMEFDVTDIVDAFKS